MECPFTEEQLEWLSENLEIEVNQSTGFYNEKYCEILLTLQGERISSTNLSINV